MDANDPACDCHTDENGGCAFCAIRRAIEANVRAADRNRPAVAHEHPAADQCRAEDALHAGADDGAERG